MFLLNLHLGRKFIVRESAGPLTGTLVKASECRALVEFDGNPTIRDFETASGDWVRIHGSGLKRTSISPYTIVDPI